MKVQIYEWLKGDGNSWIETKKNLERLTMRLFPNQETDDFQFITGVNGALRLSRNHNDLRNSDGSNVYLRNCGNTIIDVDINKERIIVNGNTFPYYINTLNGETFLFWGNQYYRLEFIYRGCIGEVVSDKFHLRPCRLLSPYTDAQGKLHPIGECCMIDINTNTLYFNSGSGAFSVEGEAGEIIDTTPYSRIMHGRNEVVVRLREWLKGDGKSFILVDHKLTQNSKMEMSAKMCSLIGTSALWGVECTEGSWTDGVWYIYQNRNGNLYNKNGLFDNYLGTYNEGDILDIVDEFSQTIINGNVYPTNRVTPILSKKVGILTAVQVNAQGDFVHGAGISWYGSVGKCSLYENGVEIIHLHPCDILHHPTLPPQSCMIDLLTGQLYTNQGTGNFTCEGADLGIWQSNPVTDMVTLDADKNVKRILSVLVMEQGMLRRIWEKNEPYEEHRWLKGDGIAYINTNIQFDYQTIQVKGKTFGEWDRIPTNYNADLAVFGAFDNWNRNLRIYAIAYRKRELRIGYGVNNANNNSLRIFQSDEDIDVFDVKMVFTEDRKNVTTTCVFNNSQEVSATTSNTAEVYPLSIIRLFNYYNDNAEFMTKFAIGDFRYGNTLHLTPVLLSRNILPNEDANGRARYKGEAVLVDKMKYKLGQPFVYGNIASSGSFSVSDYLIEGEDYEVIEGVDFNGQNSIIEANITPTAWNDMAIKADVYIPSNNYSEYVLFKGGDISAFDARWIAISRRNIYDFSWVSVGVTNEAEPRKIISKTKGSGDFSVNGTNVTCANSIIKSISIGYKTSEKSDIVVRTFTIDGVIDLIPVRLKKQIEPHCTHNGKGARQGEIGFFDKVSGKFYGNDGNGEFGEYVPD